MLVSSTIPSDLSIPDFKRMDRETYTYITANTGAIWQHSAHTIDNYLIASQQKLNKANP